VTTSLAGTARTLAAPENDQLQNHRAPGKPAAYVVDVGRHRLGHGLREVAQRARIGEHGFTARQLQRRRQGPQAGDSDFHRSGAPVQLFGEGVEVVIEVGRRAAGVDAGT
jgi:hypothetical protein